MKYKLLFTALFMLSSMTNYAQQTTQKSGTYKFLNLYDWKYIIKKIDVKAGGRDAELVFLGSEENNVISYVYLIPNGFRGPKYPPKIVSVIYHDIGEDKEFCSFVTEHVNVDPETGERSCITIEHKVNDDTANEVLDLLYGRLKYKNTSDIKLLRRKSEIIRKPKIVELESEEDIRKKFYGDLMKLGGFSLCEKGLPNINMVFEKLSIYDAENTEHTDKVNAQLRIDTKNLKAKLELKGKMYEFDLYHVYEHRNKDVSPDITFCISTKPSDEETLNIYAHDDDDEYLVHIKSKAHNIDYWLSGTMSLSAVKNFVNKYKSIVKANGLYDPNESKIVQLR